MATRTRPRTQVRPGKRATPAVALGEIGVSGLKTSGGWVQEEFLRELSGVRGRRVYREMADNDATVGAALFAISLLLRAVDWKARPSVLGSKATADAEAEFVEQCMHDMSHTWEEFVQEMLSCLVFGWSYHEIVYKRRDGADQTDPTRRSLYSDGRIGLRKLAPRSQMSLDRWEFQPDGGIAGMHQRVDHGTVFIPIERALLFRTMSRYNSPEGVSVLRSAYRSWHLLKTIQNVEAIGIERELAGLPVVRIPAKYLRSTDPDDMAMVAAYEQIARDIKFNEQGGILIPSDVYSHPDGTLTDVPLVDVKLMASAGQRSIDTVLVKKGYQQDIARSVMADFIMLGTESKGSYALSDNKTSLFLRACRAMLSTLAGVLNRHALPRLWAINGLPIESMPTLVFDQIDVVDLNELGGFIQKLAAAGMPIFPDEDLENYIRNKAGWPEKGDDGPETGEQDDDDENWSASGGGGGG